MCPFAKPNAKEVSCLALHSAYIRQTNPESHKADGAAELLSISLCSSLSSAALHHTLIWLTGRNLASCIWHRLLTSLHATALLTAAQRWALTAPASQVSRAVPHLCMMTPAVLTAPTALPMSLPPVFTAHVHVPLLRRPGPAVAARLAEPILNRHLHLLVTPHFLAFPTDR